MKYSLGVSDFPKELSSLSYSTVFLCFFSLIAEESFLISPCCSLELCMQMGISFLFSFAFSSSSFLSCLLRLLRKPFCLFAFLFLADGLDHCLLYNVMNLCPQFFRCSIRPNSLNLLLPLYNHKGFDLGHT